MVVMAAFHMQTILSWETATAILGLQSANAALCTLIKSLLSDICHRTLLASMQTLSFILISAGEASMTGKCRRTELLTRPCLIDEELGSLIETEVALEDDDSLERCRVTCFNEPLQTPEVVHKVPGKEIAAWILVAKNKDDDDEDADEDEDDDEEEEDEDDLEDDEEGEGGDDEVEGGDGGEDDDEEGDDGDDDDGEDEADDDIDDEEEDEDEDEDEEDESPPKKMKK